MSDPRRGCPDEDVRNRAAVGDLNACAYCERPTKYAVFAGGRVCAVCRRGPCSDLIKAAFGAADAADLEVVDVIDPENPLHRLYEPDPHEAPTLLDRWRKYAAGGGGISVDTMPTRPHLRITTGYIYPNGESIDVYIDASTGAMTDFADAAHWLLSVVIELPSTVPLDLMPEGTRADGYVLSLEPKPDDWAWGPADARRLAHACSVLAWTTWTKAAMP